MSARKYRTALCGRTSHDDPRTVTIEIQKQRLAAWAAQDDLVGELVGEFFDEGVSGKIPLKDRPKGRELMGLVEQGKVDSVAWMYCDRLGRTLLDGLQAAKDLEAMGIKLVFIDDGWDARRNDSPLFFQFKLMLAEDEHRRICERMRNGKARAMNRDNAPPGGPLTFGYRMGSRGEYLIDPIEGPIVIRIFEMAIEGYPNSEILAWVLTQGVLAGRKYQARDGLDPVVCRKHRGSSWHLSKIGKILRNRTYTGVRVWKDRTFPCPSLIDADTFEKIQATNRSRSATYAASKGSPSNGLLSALLTCQCGGTFYHRLSGDRPKSAGGGRYEMYACEHMIHGEGCKAKMIRVDELDRDVWELIEGYLADPGAIVRKVLAADDALAGTVRELDQEEEETQTAIQGLKQRASDILSEGETQGWPMSWVTDHLNKLNVERRRLADRLELLRQKRAALQIGRDETAAVTAALAAIRAKLKAGLSQEEKYRIVRLLVAGGTVKTLGEARRKVAEIALELKWGESVATTSSSHTPGFPKTADTEAKRMTINVTLRIGRAC